MSKTRPIPNSQRNQHGAEITVKQGCGVVFVGILGSLLAIIPSTLLLPSFPFVMYTPSKVLIPVIWAVGMGGLITYFWSKAIHERLEILRTRLFEEDLLCEDEKLAPGRLIWMPVWLGMFERGYYSLLIGLNVSGAATFIGVWVGFKLTSGWQTWGKGTTYSRALRFAGLLGNAMSLSYGIISGIVMKHLLDP